MIGMTVILVIFLTAVSYFIEYIFGSEVSDRETNLTYKYHVAMINDKSSDVFWDSVYAGAFGKGEELGIYVENFGEHLSEEYSSRELLEMAIAAKVDGIIMKADNDEATVQLLNKAAREGIPVITLLQDAPESGRKSFVSANDYDLGEIYGSQVLEAAEQAAQGQTVKGVMLIDSNSNGSAPNLIYSGMSETIAGASGQIQLDTVIVNDTGEFETEEKVRDLLLNKEQRPDILVCSSVADTTSAYQCVIDYNLVGEVQIIGYYTSPEILEGIDKGIIRSAVVINAEEMGSVSVEGMYEYLTEEYVNEYLSVSSHLITKDNVAAYYEELSKHDEK